MGKLQIGPLLGQYLANSYLDQPRLAKHLLHRFGSTSGKSRSFSTMTVNGAARIFGQFVSAASEASLSLSLD